ncbi:MAG: response regulator [Myxococcota bacterium]
MPRVLIVDDQEDIRELLRAIVEKDGHTTLQASNAREAETQLKDSVDLMLLDIDMPGETGVELLLRMRRGEVRPTVPTVFVTAYPERCSPLQATGFGANAVIVKPFRLEEVRRVLQRLLSAIA